MWSGSHVGDFSCVKWDWEEDQDVRRWRAAAAASQRVALRPTSCAYLRRRDGSLRRSTWRCLAVFRPERASGNWKADSNWALPRSWAARSFGPIPLRWKLLSNSSHLSTIQLECDRWLTYKNTKIETIKMKLVFYDGNWGNFVEICPFFVNVLIFLTRK